MTRHFQVILLLLLSLGWAQEMTVDKIMLALEQSVDTTEDARFTLVGTLVDLDGNPLEIEVEVAGIPALNLARLYFIKPEAFLDNFTVIDDTDVYNYLFVTNQVTILDINDPDALANLSITDVATSLESPVVSLDLNDLFAGWEISLQSAVTTAVGEGYTLHFLPSEDLAEYWDLSLVTIDVIAEDWYPYQFTFYTQVNEVLTTFRLDAFTRNSGLDPDDLRYIPADAEIIDER